MGFWFSDVAPTPGIIAAYREFHVGGYKKCSPLFPGIRATLFLQAARNDSLCFTGTGISGYWRDTPFRHNPSRAR